MESMAEVEVEKEKEKERRRRKRKRPTRRQIELKAVCLATLHICEVPWIIMK